MKSLERGVPASSLLDLALEAVQVASFASTAGLVVVSATQVGIL